MSNFSIKSAIVAMSLALTATASPQCATDADCLSGYICGPNDTAGSSDTSNVCVQLKSCSDTPDPQFPQYGPKCGDSVFCNPGGFCGGGYVDIDGQREGALACVDHATGLKCAAPAI
ncbi:hypothetical protein VFPPC_14130 [Pochonia chlamydosporia 170]|uniref:Uncharacterized protein n=1 Tax=Pochonia chlamydosporia 170 TaxID=1380566 RepID=A0A179FA96_METCM|nr:hypothetical protein VFPPC_14130 [Pochonia chlamydosporia 170]OAQ62455.1 hypothetical protein VFPPC_14130 [Pochonia chlamydosporia 170]